MTGNQPGPCARFRPLIPVTINPADTSRNALVESPLSTQIHIAVETPGSPVKPILTAGHARDPTQAEVGVLAASLQHGAAFSIVNTTSVNYKLSRFYLWSPRVFPAKVLRIISIQESTMQLSKKIWLFLLAPFVFLPASGHAVQFTNLYILGDSLSDVGNLFIATGPATGFPNPPGQLPQAPPYFQGRFSDGPIYAEYLQQSLGLPGNLTPSYGGGTDYAVGGARSRYHAFDTGIPGFNPFGAPGSFAFSQFSLLGQRDALLPNPGSTLDSDALYIVWEGSNDVADAFGIWLGGAPGAAQLLLQQAANDILTVIANLVAAGAQDLLVPNVPNLGLVPRITAIDAIYPGSSALATLLAQQFNGLVDMGLASLAANANIIRLDTFSFLTDLVGDPALFGLPATLNVTEACFSGYVGEGGIVCSNPLYRTKITY